MNAKMLQKLSREVSYALRHAPQEYGLELDAEGWVDVKRLLEALQKKEMWRDVSVDDLEEMGRHSDKKRHEICGGRIRAFYGHSTPEKLQNRLPDRRRFCITGRRGGRWTPLWRRGCCRRAGSMFTCRRMWRRREMWAAATTARPAF